MRVTPLVVAAVLCCIASRPGMSQVGPTLAKVQPNTHLRIQLVDSTFVVGRLLALEQRRLLLRTIVRTSVTEGQVEERAVGLDSIVGAWVQSGTRWKLGAGMGAVIGASGMLVAIAMALESEGGSSCDGWCWTSGAAVGALAGALIGGLIGQQFVVWRPVRF